MAEELVSIQMVTYNHEAFIRKSIESILNQQTNFKYKIIIGEDCSQDKTALIVREYAEKYSDRILTFINNINLGIFKNANQIREASQGKYIALCEGDDYWTDPYKLQKQVDFLEANPEYSLCFHPVKILMPDGMLLDDFITKIPEEYETLESLAEFGNYIHTPSVVFRNNLQPFPPELNLSPLGDFFIYMLSAKHGKLKCLDDNMAVYRHGVGIWSAQSEYYRLFNTAYTHALLCKVFHDNKTIFKILTKRILNFIDYNLHLIQPEDLVKFNTCPSLNLEVNSFLLKKLQTRLQYNSIEHTSSQKLYVMLKNRFYFKIEKFFTFKK